MTDTESKRRMLSATWGVGVNIRLLVGGAVLSKKFNVTQAQGDGSLAFMRHANDSLGFRL